MEVLISHSENQPGKMCSLLSTVRGLEIKSNFPHQPSPNQGHKNLAISSTDAQLLIPLFLTHLAAAELRNAGHYVPSMGSFWHVVLIDYMCIHRTTDPCPGRLVSKVRAVCIAGKCLCEQLTMRAPQHPLPETKFGLPGARASHAHWWCEAWRWCAYCAAQQWEGKRACTCGTRVPSTSYPSSMRLRIRTVPFACDEALL